MRLEISNQANKDLDALYAYGILEFGELQADRYLAELLDLFDLLLGSPKMGVQRRRFKRLVRSFPFQSHVVIYSLGRAKLKIERVVHCKQNWVELI